ncbi:MAG TPA: 4-hydroxythreonine-4-phosphate dehydrogenase PdxA [Methylophilaceae bacterium]|nr:4-hydroxythreonine-4-phosphate dehydrogenase PdxA [Methylophilaceae bacterium]
MSAPLPRILVTSGEPAGIGLDLCCMLASQPFAASLVVIADQNALQERAAVLGIKLHIEPYLHTTEKQTHSGDNKLIVMHLPAHQAVKPGGLNPANSPAVLEMLATAVRACMTKEFDAMVTCPVHKGVINDAGIPFTGHTEYLAEQTDTEHVVMMLVGGGLRVALATTHLPLTGVSPAITQESLEKTLRILHQDLMHHFGIAQPRVLVTGLNPHAGESGHLGTEEITIITPVLEKLRLDGMQLKGPLPADTLFTPRHLTEADCVLAMYHDQGLPVLKYASFGKGVNVTLGLPIIRTSVDHGTALDLAGTGKANPGSLYEAIQLAIELTHSRKRN